MGRKSAWAAARAEVIASGVMVAGWEIWGGLPVLRTTTYVEEKIQDVADTFLSYGLHMY